VVRRIRAGHTLDPQAVADGRSISRPLRELTDGDFDRLLEILSRYCGSLDQFAKSQERGIPPSLNVEGPKNSDWLHSREDSRSLE
jgi:hypothetical protein